MTDKQYKFNDVRNYDDRVPYKDLRKDIEAELCNADDDLSNCFYNFWRKGLSKEFDCEKYGLTKKIFDKQATVDESLILFDKLSGHIHSLLDEKLYDENEKQTEKDLRLKNYFDEIEEGKTKSRITELKDLIKEQQKELFK